MQSFPLLSVFNFKRRIQHRPVVFLKSFACIAAIAALGTAQSVGGGTEGGLSALGGPLRAQEGARGARGALGARRSRTCGSVPAGSSRGSSPRTPRPAAKPAPQPPHGDAERITGRDFDKCLRSPEPRCPPAASPRSPRLPRAGPAAVTAPRTLPSAAACPCPGGGRAAAGRPAPRG